MRISVALAALVAGAAWGASTGLVQTSRDLLRWTSVSTNTLAGDTLNLTNPAAAASQQFWRAVWQP